MKAFKHPLPAVLCLAALFSCMDPGPGCTDALAGNFNPDATANDGSCTYQKASVSPETSVQLDEQVSETSGLILWDGYLWTHNDNGTTDLYALDTTDGKLMQTISLGESENQEWEEIKQDRDHIYIGAFGNNTSGSRTDLHILRVSKSDLKSGQPVPDTIWFSYSDQVDLSPAAPNQTDFDCEAFLVTDEEIFLFTKQWVSANTTVYRLPKTPGTYEAEKISEHPVDGMVTGATWVESEDLVVLCGYTILVQPFLYLLYDFDGTEFFSGNKRKVTLAIPFHQVEGIATGNGLKYYISNELFAPGSGIHTPQKLHVFYLTELLQGYLEVDP